MISPNTSLDYNFWIMSRAWRVAVPSLRDCLVRVVVLGSALGVVAACSSAPRTSPIPTTRIEGGEGSLQAMRQRIAGTWNLVSYRTFDASGQATDLPATGQVTADEFGNIEFVGELTGESDQGVVRQPLNTSGRLAIDLPMRRFLVLRVEEDEATTAAFAAAPLTQFRYYEFVGDDELHITVKDENDATTAVTVYRRP